MQTHHSGLPNLQPEEGRHEGGEVVDLQIGGGRIGPVSMQVAPRSAFDEHRAHADGLGWQNIVVEAIPDVSNPSRL
jgi:hypothetical protein